MPGINAKSEQASVTKLPNSFGADVKKRENDPIKIAPVISKKRFFFVSILPHIVQPNTINCATPAIRQTHAKIKNFFLSRLPFFTAKLRKKNENATRRNHIYRIVLKKGAGVAL